MRTFLTAALAPLGLLLAAAVSAQGSCESHLLVSGYNSHTVSIFDACSGEYLRELDNDDRIRGPQAVRFNPADSLIYVVSESNGLILRYRSSDYEFVDVFAQFAVNINPTGIDFGPDGQVYVASYGTDRVLRLDPASGAETGVLLPATSGLLGPDNGMGVGPDGSLYVPGYDSNSVARVNLGSAQVNANYIATGSGGLIQSRGILFEPGGQTMLLTGEGSGAVYRVRLSDGAILETLISGLSRPTGIALAPDGSLLVLASNIRVFRFDRETGAELGTFLNAGPTGTRLGTYLAVVPNPQMDTLDTTQIGSQYWIFGSGPVQSRSLMAEMVSVTGGVFGSDFNPDNVIRKRWGTITVSFTACDRAVFSYDSTGTDSANFGSLSYAVVRLVDTEATLLCRTQGFDSVAGMDWMSGAWYSVDRSGEGVLLEVSADGIAVVSFYTHRPAQVE